MTKTGLSTTKLWLGWLHTRALHLSGRLPKSESSSMDITGNGFGRMVQLEPGTENHVHARTQQ